MTSRPPPSGAMLGGGRFAGTMLGAGRARGFGAGIEPGGGRDGGPRGFGTGWSGNLMASGALTGTTSTGDVCGCSTATGSATSRDAGPGTRGFFGCGWTGGDVARFPSGDGKADRAASNDA